MFVDVFSGRVVLFGSIVAFTFINVSYCFFGYPVVAFLFQEVWNVFVCCIGYAGFECVLQLDIRFIYNSSVDLPRNIKAIMCDFNNISFFKFPVWIKIW